MYLVTFIDVYIDYSINLKIYFLFINMTEKSIYINGVK